MTRINSIVLYTKHVAPIWHDSINLTHLVLRMLGAVHVAVVAVYGLVKNL